MGTDVKPEDDAQESKGREMRLSAPRESAMASLWQSQLRPWGLTQYHVLQLEIKMGTDGHTDTSPKPARAE